MTLACIFPGQGSQRVGMCKDLYSESRIAKNIFDEVDYTLGYKLSDIIFEGPADELTLTRNAQPALMVTSIAILKVVEERLNKKLPEFCSYVAGHSLGEITALTASNAISLVDAAKILQIRGQSMQDAVPSGEGAMFALLGANISIAKQVAQEGGCEVANDNSPDQQILSGSVASIDLAINIAKSQGFKTIKLKVSGPFHSKLMIPAQEKLAEYLDSVTISEPDVPLIANVTADVTSVEFIKDNLINQVTGMVRWCESIKRLKDLGVKNIAEIGYGNVYTNLNKRIDSSIRCISSEDLLSQDLETI